MKTRPRAQDFAHEHALLRKAIRELRAEIRRLRKEPGPDHSVGWLRARLELFQERLRRHFELEERDQALLAACREPGTERVVKGLYAEHRELERALELLVVDVASCDREDACLSDRFAAELEKLLQGLETHERAETELLQKAIYRETGGGD